MFWNTIHDILFRREFLKLLMRIRHRRSSKCDVKRTRANSKLKSSSFCYFFCDCAKQTESNWKCGNARNQELEMDPMGEEAKFLLLRRTNEPTPPLLPIDSRTDAHADCGAEAGISATASTPTTPEKPTPTPSKSKQSYCHFNVRKKGVFWFDRRHVATPNQNSEVSANFYGSEINQRNFNYCVFEWGDETTAWASRATPRSHLSADL